MRIGGQGWSAEDVAARREELFNTLDQDDDKKITKDEINAAAASRAGRGGRSERGPSLDELFSRIDTNGDGGIDREEHDAFLTSLESRRPQGPPTPSQIAEHLFKRGDADGDGTLTKAELTSALKHAPSDALDKLFEDADGDGDGAITKAELQSSLEKRLQGAASYDQSGGVTAATGSSRLLGIA